MILAIILFILFVIPLAAIWSGYVFSVLWSWFIVSLFPVMPQLLIPAAIGLGLIVVYGTRHAMKEDKKEVDADYLVGGALKLFLYPAYFLFLGWIVQKFI